ncbi:MAG: hypothetical protein V8R14_06065 [Clostridia bacterium]
MERKTLKRTVIALFVLAVVFFSGNTRAAMQEKDTAAVLGSMISAVCSGGYACCSCKVQGSGGFAD